MRKWLSTSRALLPLLAPVFGVGAPGGQPGRSGEGRARPGDQGARRRRQGRGDQDAVGRGHVSARHGRERDERRPRALSGAARQVPARRADGRAAGRHARHAHRHDLQRHRRLDGPDGSGARRHGVPHGSWRRSRRSGRSRRRRGRVALAVRAVSASIPRRACDATSAHGAGDAAGLERDLRSHVHVRRQGRGARRSGRRARSEGRRQFHRAPLRRRELAPADHDHLHGARSVAHVPMATQRGPPNETEEQRRARFEEERKKREAEGPPPMVEYLVVPRRLQEGGRRPAPASLHAAGRRQAVAGVGDQEVQDQPARSTPNSSRRRRATDWGGCRLRTPGLLARGRSRLRRELEAHGSRLITRLRITDTQCQHDDSSSSPWPSWRSRGSGLRGRRAGAAGSAAPVVAARHGARSDRRRHRRRERDGGAARAGAAADGHCQRARRSAVRQPRRPASTSSTSSRPGSSRSTSPTSTCGAAVRRSARCGSRSASSSRRSRSRATRPTRCSTTTSRPRSPRSRSTRSRTTRRRCSSSSRTWPGPARCCASTASRAAGLPPKSQIAEIRFRFDPYSAENHESGFPRVDIRTRPGNGNWRNSAGFTFRDESLNARNAFAETKGAEQARRYQWSIDGPLAKGKTSFSLFVGGLSSYDSQTIIARSDGASRPRSRSRTIASTSTRASSTRSRRTRCCASSSRATAASSGTSASASYDLDERAYDRERAEQRVPHLDERTGRAQDAQRAALRVRLGRLDLELAERRGDDPGAGVGALWHFRRRADQRRPPVEDDRARRQPRFHARQEPLAAHRRSCSRAAGIAATKRATTPAPSRSRRDTASRLGLPLQFSQRLGNPLVEYQAWELGTLHQRRHPRAQAADGERRPARGSADPSRRQRQPRAARRT